MGRKSMFKYGLPLAANSLWPQIKWTLQCQRALDLTYTDKDGKKKRLSASIARPSALTSASSDFSSSIMAVISLFGSRLRRLSLFQ